MVQYLLFILGLEKRLMRLVRLVEFIFLTKWQNLFSDSRFTILDWARHKSAPHACSTQIEPSPWHFAASNQPIKAGDAASALQLCITNVSHYLVWKTRWFEFEESNFRDTVSLEHLFRGCSVLKIAIIWKWLDSCKERLLAGQKVSEVAAASVTLSFKIVGPTGLSAMAKLPAATRQPG